MKIAIQGHPVRGKEIIQILNSLGGINSLNLLGNNNCRYYYIDDNNTIMNLFCDINYKSYTLEEFEKEFPFKVGDKVKYITSVGTIRKYCYINNKPAYEVESMELGIITNILAEMLKPYKEMQERNITLTLDKAKEWYKKGGELKEIALQAYSEEELTKAELPKSWKEYCVNYPIKEGEYYIDMCSDIILASSGPNEGREIEMDRNICPSKESAEAHLTMIQLEQLRDCYRGLFITVIGMPVWCIIRHKGRLVITQRIWGTNETFLSFQSHEVAEEYLKNFEPLIKQARDLI